MNSKNERKTETNNLSKNTSGLNTFPQMIFVGRGLAGVKRKVIQAVCLLLIFCLLTLSAPAAPLIAVEKLAVFQQNIIISFKLNDWFSVFSRGSAKAPKPETREEREAKVERIEINASDSTFVVGERIPLVAIAYDRNNNPVSAVRFTWEVIDAEGNRQEPVTNYFDAETIGEYKVTARGAGRESTGKFIIRKAVDEMELKSLKDSNSQQLLLPFEEWNVENIPHANNIKNVRGNPPGKPKGKNNFNITAPALSIPGRGLNLDLNFYYNSLVWSLVNQDISYDMDKDWLSPGWNLGFGKIVNLINGGIVQVDPDGTRRFYSGEIQGQNDKITFKGQSTDGTFIKALNDTSVSANGQCFSNPNTYLKYPNGTTVWYRVWKYSNCYGISDPITMVPASIQDRNGNQMLITYHAPAAGVPEGRWIDKIIDTVGRVYTFNYTLMDNKYYLTSISGRGLPSETPNEDVMRTFVRLGYKNHTITHNFTGLTPHVRESNIKVLASIYYPATQSGYWFGDSDSYSPYGMIRKVDEQRTMSYSEQAGISAGQMTRRRVYSYPTGTATALSDTPTFETVTESWEGMPASVPAPVTTYLVNWDANPRTTTTVAPDLTKIIEYSYNLSSLSDTDPEKARDGLTYKTESKDPSDQLRSKSEIEWELGHQVNTCPTPPNNCVATKIPRPKKITQSVYENGNTLTKITQNESFGEYNQVTEVKEIGYGGPTDVLRRTVTEYIKKGDAPTTGIEWEALPRLISLPTIVEVFDANNNRIGYSKNEYDLNPLKPFSGVNPVNFCGSPYCSAVTERGNLSKTTTYENSAVLTTGAISDDRAYDKAGNLVEIVPEVSATTLIKYKYTDATEYAFSEETATASNNTLFSIPEIKSSAVYNLNTGLQLSATDLNQQTIQFTYDVQDWRLKRVDSPTGNYSSYLYDDLNRAFTKVEFAPNNSVVTKQVQKVNGLGLPYRQETLAKVENNQEIWDVVETEYDEYGRMKRTSNPFRSNENPHGVYWSEVFYDVLGRVWKTVSPDGSTKFNYFNEAPASRPQGASSAPGQTFKVKDPIGRERWYRTDSDDNVAEVIEPAPDGSGAVATGGLVTKYTYDKLKRLTQTEQGVQIRKFRYDSLGRLTHQKMAETKATLDDSGTFVGEATGTWSDFYTYDKSSNIITYKDARGVTTSYSYLNASLPGSPPDPLNRLFSISYNTNGAADVLSSPTISFAYEPTGNISRLKTVTTAGVSSVDLGYDSRGRINEKKTTVLTRPNEPMTVNYVYDSVNRVSDTIYPVQHGAGGLRKTLHYDYDSTERVSALKVDNVNYASDFVFNAFGQTQSFKIGASGSNQMTETYNYNPVNGLLQNQKVLRGATALLDLSYEYQQCSCSTGGSGQITKIVDNLNRNKDRGYEYDALGRLKKVTGGINQGWSQVYSYDRYGNRNGVVSSGFENLRGTDSESENEQQKILSQSLPAQPPTVKSLLANVKNSARTELKTSNNSSSPAKESTPKETSKTQGSQQTTNENQNLLPPQQTPFDFDLDNKADFAIWQRSGGNWVVNQSTNNQTVTEQFGANGNQIAPGDYDGDGKTDKAVWIPASGYWWIKHSSNGNVVPVQWGQAGDSIVPADYDGDGKTDIAVWRPTDGVWYILHSLTGSWSANPFGNQTFGDIPVPGDYDGDGKADVAVWRPSTGNWYIYRSSDGQVTAPQFGAAGDVPVPAKYDSDNKTDLAVWRVSNGVWYVLPSTTGNYTATQWGAEIHRDVLVPADYDADGKADKAVWRSTTGYWYVLRSSDGGVTSYQQGTSGNIPVPSAYIRRSSAPKNQSQDIPRDGLASVTYDESSNRITTNANFTYDAAGNQTQIQREDGTIIRYQYDAAGRLVKVKNSSNQTLVTYTYGDSRERLIAQEGDESSTNRTYYAWEGGAVISEYTDSAGSTLVWSKNYIYLGGALLATQEKITGGERLQFNHNDRLGTRIVTNPVDGSSFEQATLPFGTALESESTGSTNRRFTSYDRNSSTRLDYAINRFYDSSQGRFTQVDPIKMEASTVLNPQSLNLYAYCGNDPINRVDPDGQFWGWVSALFGFFKSFFKGTTFRFNFNIRGFPIGFGFSGHFKNIFIGIAGFEVQITGKGSISSLIKNWSNNTSTTTTNCEDQILVKVGVEDRGDGTIRKNNFFYLHRDVVNDFNAALNDILIPIFTDAIVAGRENNIKKFNASLGLLGSFGFTELFRTYSYQKYLWDNRHKNPNKVGDPRKYPFHLLGAAFDISTSIQKWVIRGRTVRQIFEAHNFTWFGSGDKPHFTHNSFLNTLSDDKNLEKRKVIAEQAENYFNECIMGRW